MLYYETNDELYHYGVLGMKWGVHRATYKSGRNQKLERKAAKQDKKAADLYRKAEKAHAKYDLGKANKAAAKAGKYAKKAAKTCLYWLFDLLLLRLKSALIIKYIAIIKSKVLPRSTRLLASSSLKLSSLFVTYI